MILGGLRRAEADDVRLRRAAELAASTLPALLAEAERIAATVAQGVHGRRRRGAGETFWEYRRWRHEDSAALVDWRRSARSDELFVRENEWEAANTVWLWRDGREGMDWRSDDSVPTKKDRGAVLMIATAMLLIQAGERCAVLGEGPPGRGAPGIDRAARALALSESGSEALSPAAVARHGRIALASDFLEPPEVWQKRLAAFADRNATGVMIQVIDPAEEEFPYQGRTLFEAPTGGDELMIGRAEAVAGEYRARFAAHRAALADVARRADWMFLTHRTDQPAARALLALHQAMGREA
jgi:uncharacterized protein (DUF58 family)